jgi:hypothetical protein
LGGTTASKEATPKPGVKKLIAKEMHTAENAQDGKNRRVWAILVVK